MTALLVGAWFFYMVSFCVLGIVCRLACRGRIARGGTCVCGRHSDRERVAPFRGRTATPTSRLRSAEPHVRALQQRYVEGLLSMEQYEVELDRVVGLA
jgi:hypothetical protein